MGILETQKHFIDVKCPHCQEESNHEIEVDIYEPSIDISVDVK